jgi:hypothetical protein
MASPDVLVSILRIRHASDVLQASHFSKTKQDWFYLYQKGSTVSEKTPSGPKRLHRPHVVLLDLLPDGCSFGAIANVTG